MRQRSTPPIAPLLFLAAIATFPVACRTRDASPDSAAPRALLATAARADSVALAGALRKPLADHSATEFRDFVATLRFGGGIERRRKCRGDARCESTTATQTSARIDAVDGQDSIGPSTLGPYGVVAARLKVTGAHAEWRYGMRPGPFEYYMVVLPDAPGRATWRLLQLESAGGVQRLTEVGSGTFQACVHEHEIQKQYRANFYSCASVPRNDSTSKLGLLQANADAEPAWVTCSSGCCTFQ